MTKTPSLSYVTIIHALQRDGWVVVRQKGSHIRLQKHTRTER
jgi:predicted RNA binding protein YcfA (HicA-like mRNA interferase family)